MGNSANLPTRLDHNAYVTSDIEATRHFYEDLTGMPLIATWCEADEWFVAFSGSQKAARSHFFSSHSLKTRSSSGRKCQRRRFITLL